MMNNNKCFLVILVFFSLIVTSQFTLALQDCTEKADNTICDWTGSYVCCDEVCTNVAWDNENCGGCGVKCASDQICSGTVCECKGYGLDCKDLWWESDTACESDSRSDNSCGGCGNICGGSGVTESVCSNEMCVCTQTGYLNADGDWSNGCEEYDPPCEDSDGGKNYAVKGTTTKGGITRTDSCEEPNNVLKEWYCDENDEVFSELHNCGSGYICYDGICHEESTDPNIPDDPDTPPGEDEESCGGTKPAVDGVEFGASTYSSQNKPSKTNWNYVTEKTLTTDGKEILNPCQWNCIEGYEPNLPSNPSGCIATEEDDEEEIEDCTPIDCDDRECGSDGCTGFCPPNNCQSNGYSCKDEIGFCYSNGCGFVDYTINDPETCDFTQSDGRYAYEHPEDILCKRQSDVYGALKKCDILKCNTTDSFCSYNKPLGIANSLIAAEKVCLKGQKEVSKICEGVGAPNCNPLTYKDVIYYAPSVFMDTNAQRNIYFASGKNYTKSSNELKTYVSDDFLKFFTEFVMDETGSDNTQAFYDKFGFIPQDLFDDVLFTHCAYRGAWAFTDPCDGNGPNDVHIYTVCPKIKDKNGNSYEICSFSLSSAPFSATTQNPRCTAVIRTGTTALKNIITANSASDDYCSERDDSKKDIDWYSIAEGSVCGYDENTVSICVKGNCQAKPPNCGKESLQTGDGEECDYNQNKELVYISTLTQDRLCQNNNNFYESDLEEWASGEIKCNTETCTLDFSDCKTQGDLCGDGTLQEWEECDGSLFGDKDTCEKRDPKYVSGNLLCENCKIDFAGCIAKPETEKGYCFDGKNNDDYFDSIIPVGCGGKVGCLNGDVDTCTDCQDKDCDKEILGNKKCEFQTEISCGDNFDNDGDGKTDAEDSDCLHLFDWNGNDGYCSIYYRDAGNDPCYTQTECVKHGTQREDYVCNDGTWISRKLLAVNDILTNFNANSYILHCGSHSEVFNRIGYTTDDFKNVQGVLSSCVDFACAYKSDTESAVLLSIKSQCKPSGNTWAFKDYFPSYIFTKTPPEISWYSGNGYKKVASVSSFSLLLNPNSNFLVYSNRGVLQASTNTNSAKQEISSINGVANVNEFKSNSFDSFFIYKSGSAKSIGKRLAGKNGFYTAVQFLGMNIDYVCDSLNAKYPDAPICTKSSGSGGYIFSTSDFSGAEVYSKYWPEYSLMVFDSSFT